MNNFYGQIEEVPQNAACPRPLDSQVGSFVSSIVSANSQLVQFLSLNLHVLINLKTIKCHSAFTTEE